MLANLKIVACGMVLAAAVAGCASKGTSTDVAALTDWDRAGGEAAPAAAAAPATETTESATTESTSGTTTEEAAPNLGAASSGRSR